MIAKITAPTEEIYGIAPVPIDPDNMPDRIPIEMLQAPTIEQIAEFLKDLEAHLGDIASLFMISNIPIRYNPENHRLFVAPDWYISFNVDIAAIRYETSYNVWEIGKPPEFALEVASPSTFQRDIYEKPGIYARIGIQEYWMFDPTGGRLYGQPLAGFRLADGEYEPIEIALNEHGVESGYSEALRLRLCSLERSRLSELESIQPGMALEDDYNPARLLFQNRDTGLYLLGARARIARAEEAEREREQAERGREQAERGREQAETRASLAETRFARAESEIERLRERIRHMEQE